MAFMQSLRKINYVTWTEGRRRSSTFKVEKRGDQYVILRGVILRLSAGVGEGV